MKVLKFKGKMSLRKKLLIALIIILVISGIGVSIAYIVNEDVREWINVNILRKDITEDDVASIKIDSDKSQYIYAYDKYIVILSNGKLTTYNSYASKAHELDLQISNPIFQSNGVYLAIAENGGQKIYSITDR